jgi:hypothetical protein
MLDRFAVNLDGLEPPPLRVRLRWQLTALLPSRERSREGIDAVRCVEMVSCFSFHRMPHNLSIIGPIFRFDWRFSHSEFGSFLSLQEG